MPTSVISLGTENAQETTTEPEPYTWECPSYEAMSPFMPIYGLFGQEEELVLVFQILLQVTFAVHRVCVWK